MRSDQRGMSRRRPAIRRVVAAAGAAVALTATVSIGQVAPAGAAPLLGMSVVGNQLYRDGFAFLPRGFNMIGLLAPDGCASPPGMAVKARAAFGVAELSAARDQWAANTVRFQVSQRGLDPLDPMYVPAYLERVKAGVALARSLGLVVILSMQDQGNGCGSAHPMPSDATVRSWQNLGPWFAVDPYVMYEMFNEPQSLEDAASWAQWRDGGVGPTGNQGAPVVGHRQLVQTLRDSGSQNVLIADGANFAGRLQGLPLLSDPLGAPQIAYAWHPYYFHLSNVSTLAADQANWDSRTSGLVAAAPVIATEWNASAGACTTGTAQRVPDLLTYLLTKRIGLLGHAFDVSGTMVNDLTIWTPTTLTGFGCGAVGSDAGQLVHDSFGQQAAGQP